MPIYEFYCHDCHTIFSFFSRRVGVGRTPACPKSPKHKLQRQVSAFAATGRASEDKGPGDLPVDDAKMERAMGLLEKEAANVNEEDPRQAARLMRKFSDMTGMQLGSNMEQALNRLEAGEDPDKVEADMGDLLEGGEEPFILPEGKGAAGSARRPPPKHDETLHEM